MSTPLETVRRPISAKIFGIALVLIVLMVCVTLVSSLSLRRVGQQLDFLSRYFIVLDQKVADVRAYGLSELILIERLLQERPRLSPESARGAAKKYQQEAGECSTEATRGAINKIRSAFAARGDQQLVIYEFIKQCAADKLGRVDALAAEAFAMDVVQRDPASIALMADLRHSLRDLPEARADLHGEFEKFLAAADKSNPELLAALRASLDEARTAVSRRISAVNNALDAATRDSASKVLQMERRVQWISWGITAGACLFGLLIAAYLTRNLVQPVRDLVVGTRQVEQGDLNVKIRIKSADEIAQLADSFNRMVSELRQKEAIKETFGKYVDPRVVEGLLGGDNFAQGGDRRVMTVFFSDLAGFTSLSETLTPTRVVNLLNEYFTYVCEPIRRHHGIVDKYIGDSVMAFWGPPFSPEANHAALGCMAALEQRERLEQFQRRLPDILGMRKGVPALRVRMGFATGEVVVGSIGSDNARSYTVIGDTVNLASRLEGTNKSYGTDILIDENTWLAVRDGFEAREIDLVRVVGRDEPTRIYELLGRKGGVSDSVLALRDAFEKALALYRQQRWQEAEAGFAECLRLEPDDGPSQVFVDRVRQFVAVPPAAGWDGSWTATSK